MLNDFPELLQTGQLMLAGWIGRLGWMELVEASFVALSIAGQHFNVRQDIRGFYFWALSNLGAIVLFGFLRRWMAVALYVYQFMMCLEGIRRWRRISVAVAGRA